MNILVVGATGSVGGVVALGLAARGERVRALVRSGTQNSKSGPLSDVGIEVIPGDLTEPASLALACKGVDVVISTVTSMPTNENDGLRQVDLEGTLALIEAATRARVRRFVYVSYSKNITIASPLQTAKRTCEQRLLDSNMDVEILRPSYFIEVWSGPHLGIDPANGTARVFGTGANRTSCISAADVADFAIAAATRSEPGKHIVEMGGPEPLTQIEIINIIGEHAGREMKLNFVPYEALVQQYENASDPLQKTFAALILAYADGDLVEDAQANAEKYGVKLTGIREVLARQRAAAA